MVSSRIVKKGLWCVGAIALLLLMAFTAIGGWDTLANLKGPARPYDPAAVPPAPAYSEAKAWLAFPGQNGLERSTPPDMTATPEGTAPADVFFIHPTTFKGNAVWVAPYDASDEQAPLNPAVLLNQASVFNGCCRIYSPHYRQASLAALKTPAAMTVAYSDIARAFRFYVEHYNKGRPIIIASHSQGTTHAIRLIQEEVLAKPLKQQLVAAYLIGSYVPDTFGNVGLPICDSPRQFGCVLSYNASEAGRNGARSIVTDQFYWWQGVLTTKDTSKAVCVNPLTWRRDSAAPIGANSGSLPFPSAPFAHSATRLTALTPHLTGAVCRDKLLNVEVPWSAPSGFIDKLSLMMGSYHLNDYGLFHAALRSNASQRVAAWRAANDAR